jgi:DNA-binding NtrC family response regulator
MIKSKEGILVLWDESCYPMTVEQAEKEMIIKYLQLCEGNKTIAAKILGMSLKTLYNKLHQYGMMEKR